MRTNDIRIKWAGPNTPYIEFVRTDTRVYPTKQELLDLQKELNSFISYYEDSFEEPAIHYVDEVDEELFGGIRDAGC